MVDVSMGDDRTIHGTRWIDVKPAAVASHSAFADTDQRRLDHGSSVAGEAMQGEGGELASLASFAARGHCHAGPAPGMVGCE